MSDEQVSATVTPRRRSPAEAAQLVAEFEASGLSRREFCRGRGLNVSTLDAYRKRRRLLQHEGAGEARWVAVELEGSRQPNAGGMGSGLTVTLRKGRRVEVECGFDAATLERLLPLLERL